MTFRQKVLGGRTRRDEEKNPTEIKTLRLQQGGLMYVVVWEAN